MLVTSLSDTDVTVISAAPSFKGVITPVGETLTVYSSLVEYTTALLLALTGYITGASIL